MIDSISIARLVAFIRDRFGLEIPFSEMVAANMRNIRALTDLVVRIGAERERKGS